MSFVKQFNVLLGILYLIGLKPVTTIDSKLKTVVNIFPSVLCLTITMYLSFFPHLRSFGVISVMIYYGTLVPSLLMILSANGQCCYSKGSYESILIRIGKLEKTFNDKSSSKISLQYVALRYRLKTLYIYIVFVLSQVLVFTEVWFLDSQHICSAVLISLLRAMYPMNVLHIILYCDIVTMFFKKLNEEIHNSPVFVHSSHKIEFLKYVKLIHMDLWKLVGQINIFFGWNLLFTTMYLFIYITHQLYWIYIATHAQLDILGLIEGLVSFLYGMSTLLILVNSCDACSSEDLIEYIEQYAFWSTENVQLHHMKQEILSQIRHLPMYISARGFLTVDRKFLSGVIASCCMYMVIFIQFFQAAQT